jgi:hypothetical protein
VQKSLDSEKHRQAKLEICIGLCIIFSPAILSFWAHRTIIIEIPLQYWVLLVGASLFFIIRGSYHLVKDSTAKFFSETTEPPEPVEQIVSKFKSGEISDVTFQEKLQSQKKRLLSLKKVSESDIIGYQESKDESEESLRRLEKKKDEDGCKRSRVNIEVLEVAIEQLKDRIKNIQHELDEIEKHITND